MIEAAQDQADLWAVRKAGLGLLLSVPGDRKPISFIEDVTVPVEQLGEYVRRVSRLLAEHGTHGAWYAHASGGCLHMRPLIDLKSADGPLQMRSIADGVLAIALEMRGALSGEHGDGISHTEYNPKLFGPEITRAFQRIKHEFDPDGLLNPGRVVMPEGAAAPPRMDASLRYGPAYRAHVWPTTFHFERERGLARAIEDCNGAGLCLKSDGVMCPSYQALRQEAHSTRGRANALRAAISGQLGPQALTSPSCTRCSISVWPAKAAGRSVLRPSTWPKSRSSTCLTYSSSAVCRCAAACSARLPRSRAGLARWPSRSTG